MSETAGYWDVHQCAWVGAEPRHVVPPAVTSDEVPRSRDDAVPEQRTAVDPAAVAAPSD